MGLFSTNLSIGASKMSSVCLLLHYIILQHTTSHKIMLPPCVKLYLTSEHDAIQRTHNTFSHSAAPNQTKLHLVAPHTIPASCVSRTTYFVCDTVIISVIYHHLSTSESLGSFSFDVWVAAVWYKYSDFTETFPGFMFGTTWSMDASTTSLQTVIELQLICTQVDLELAINYWAIYSAVPMGEELFMWRMGRHGRSSKLKLHFLEACSYWSISGREILGRFASDGTCWAHQASGLGF